MNGSIFVFSVAFLCVFRGYSRRACLASVSELIWVSCAARELLASENPLLFAFWFMSNRLLPRSRPKELQTGAFLTMSTGGKRARIHSGSWGTGCFLPCPCGSFCVLPSASSWRHLFFPRSLGSAIDFEAVSRRARFYGPEQGLAFVVSAALFAVTQQCHPHATNSLRRKAETRDRGERDISGVSCGVRSRSSSHFGSILPILRTPSTCSNVLT